MRNLYILLGKILKLIPETESEFISYLIKDRETCMYTAPEAMLNLWNRVGNEIFFFTVAEKNKEEWHYQVISEWSMGNIDEIKKSFEDRG